jgi:uncharacterized protein involved in exopolysaccharide biosynthesis
MSGKYKLKKDRNNEVSFLSIFSIIASYIKIILIIPTVLCTITIVKLQFFTKPTFTSQSKIMSSSGSNSLGQASGIAAQFGINIPSGGSNDNWVYKEIILSRQLASRVLDRKFTTDEFGQQKTLVQILTYGNEIPQLGYDTLKIKATANLHKMISVKEDKITKIITISVEANESKLATEINNSFIQELDSHQRLYTLEKNSETRIFIGERIKTTEKELMESEENLKVFNGRNRRIENSPALQLEQQRLQREVAVLTGVFTTLKQQLEMAKIEEVKKSDYVIIVDYPSRPLIRSKPDKKVIIMLTGVLSLGLGLVCAFLLNFLKDLNSEDKNDIKKIIRLTIINVKQLLLGKLF